MRDRTHDYGGVNYFFYRSSLINLHVSQPSNRDKQRRIHRQEAILELEYLGENSVTKDDLIVSIKNLASLASLQRSVVITILLFQNRISHNLFNHSRGLLLNLIR